jgi:NAD(P)-dependent dehydrogenase (short-subunit alcohol dehydrogenase family)
LVSGANRGLGFEISRQLAARGCEVMLTARDPRRGKRAARQLREQGLAVSFYPLDVADPLSIQRLAGHVREVGRVDILINNAAIAIDHQATLLDVPVRALAATLETNLQGALRLCQAVVPLMRERGYGRIVNVSSARGSFARLRKGRPGGPCYRISKTSLNALTCLLAEEVKEENILVNAMCPGWCRTRLGGLAAPRSVQEGAATAVWLATLPDGGPSGKFFVDLEEFPW